MMHFYMLNTYECLGTETVRFCFLIGYSFLQEVFKWFHKNRLISFDYLISSSTTCTLFFLSFSKCSFISVLWLSKHSNSDDIGLDLLLHSLALAIAMGLIALFHHFKKRLFSVFITRTYFGCTKMAIGSKIQRKKPAKSATAQVRNKVTEWGL